MFGPLKTRTRAVFGRKKGKQDKTASSHKADNTEANDHSLLLHDSDTSSTASRPTARSRSLPTITRGLPSRYRRGRHSTQTKASHNMGPTFSHDQTTRKQSHTSSFSGLFSDDDSNHMPADTPSNTAVLSQTQTQTVTSVDFTMMSSSRRSTASTPPLARRHSSVTSNRGSLGHRNTSSSPSIHRRSSSRSRRRNRERTDSGTSTFASLSSAVVKAYLNHGKEDFFEGYNASPSKDTTTETSLAVKMKNENPNLFESRASDGTPSPSFDIHDSSLLPPLLKSQNGRQSRSSAMPSPTPSPLQSSPPKASSPKASSTQLDPDLVKVPINAPVHNPHFSTGHQWRSPLQGTSRPRDPWGWTKRWTCCHCCAETIVEQKVCSRLTCAHARCPLECTAHKKKHT